MGGRYLFLIGCFNFLFEPVSLAQDVESRSANLLRLFNEANHQYQSGREAVIAYSQKNRIPIFQRNADGSTVLLQAIDDRGNPVFLATDNAGAAVTTGVDKVRSGGGLGLNLTGEGARVTIWDGGKVSDHAEFLGRLQANEGSTDDNHATHVLGTIGASGINPLAQGMAPRSLLAAWDFENDLAEMVSQAKPDQTGTILSNHSYDQVAGWRFNNNQWNWFGDASVSAHEDWKFGFYGPLARSWDDLAYNSPYYTIVKSAGNDRADVGNGSRPSDCNAGSGFDCIGVRAVAKNIITVGAVRKLLNYQEPGSVQMSSFSAWGPTDDGRIKPDVVAAGVDLFSTSAAGVNQYTTLSGTSMATPNVTGSLALVQQLYRNLRNNMFMRASTLKALAIHTAKEAGPFPGPDYSYGWGLLDVGAAAKVLLDQDNQNVFVIEDTLRQNQTFTLRLLPQAGKKITATLVWTDPAGAPVAVSLDPTNLMLVNDLDMQLFNEAGGKVEPWILNPLDPAQQASRGNNVRDNVEKIEFDDPEPRDYTLAVSHKKSITGPYQVFSLIVTYASLIDPRPKLFWVGGSGSWQDPLKWSASSGGPPANRTPTADDRVIFDENSFSEIRSRIRFTGPAVAHSLTVLSSNEIELDFQQQVLSISAGLLATHATLISVSEGRIRFVGPSGGEIIAPKSDLTKAALEILGDSTWQLNSDLKVKELRLTQGAVETAKNTLQVESFFMAGTAPRSIVANETVFAGVRNFVVERQAAAFNVTKSTVQLIGTSEQPAVISNDGLALPVEFSLQGIVRLRGTGTYARMIVGSDLEIQGSNSFDQLTVRRGSVIRLGSNTLQKLTRNTLLESAANQLITLRADSKATLNFDGHYKLCFDFLSIVNTDLSGNAIVNAGAASTLVNSNNWFSMPCADVLFPDFSFTFPCKDGFTQFKDNSSGLFDQRVWSFGNGLGTSTEKNPIFQFADLGSYHVALTLTKSGVSRSFSRSVPIVANDLPVNEILFSSSTFFSTVPSGNYQWYKDMLPIAGATNRSYTWNGDPGRFLVVIASENCNRPSNVIVITGLEDSIHEPKVFPNPNSGDFVVESEPGTTLRLSSAVGATVWQAETSEKTTAVNTSGLAAGMYYLLIQNSNGSRIQKVIIVD